MHYGVFLRQLHALSASCEGPVLLSILYDLARTLPEEQREDFLSTVRRHNTPPCVSSQLPDLESQVQSALSRLQSIDNGERILDAQYYWPWGDWDRDKEGMMYTDTVDILPDISFAFSLLRRCVDFGAYQVGAELAEKLAFLTITAEGEYLIGSLELQMPELIKNKLLEIDYTKAVAEAGYLVLAHYKDPAMLLCVLQAFACERVLLTNILQVGPELDIDSFTTRWMDILAQNSSHYARALFLEAFPFIPTASAALEAARKYAKVAPIFYEQFLQLWGASDPQRALATGQEALQIIPVIHPDRPTIALHTASFAHAVDQRDAAESCYLEAFRSDMSPVNYLRLRLETRDLDRFLPQARTAYQAVKKQDPRILFFDAQFSTLTQKYMRVPSAVDWSQTFMPQGLALFLLLLHEGIPTGDAMARMIRVACAATSFTVAAYTRGLPASPFLQNLQGEEQTYTEDQFAFIQAIQKWKKTLDLTEPQRDALLDTVWQWIDQRVSVIVPGKYRDYYSECGSYIAAYGKIRESLGVHGAQRQLLAHYEAKYPRHSSFLGSIRGYCT